jgi:hypothetical protein
LRVCGKITFPYYYRAGEVGWEGTYTKLRRKAWGEGERERER